VNEYNAACLFMSLTSYRRETAANSTETVLTGFCVVLFCFLFVLPWWNRYLGITNEGWYQFCGVQILSGHIPYRDFHLFVPPGQALTMAALTKAFGVKLIVPELFGFLAVLVISAALYLWLVRLFPIFWVTVAIIASSAISLRYSTESLSGLHLAVFLYSVLAVLSASFALSGTLTAILLTGFIAGLSLVTKQTSGIAATVSLGLTLPVLIWRRSGVRAGLRTAAAFTFGWLVPLVSVAIWLAAHHALRAFVDAVILQGPSSKGSARSLLTRQISGTYSDHPHMAAAALAITVVAFFGIYSLIRRKPESTSSDVRSWSAVAFAVVASAVLLWAQHAQDFAEPKSRLDFVFQIAPLYMGQIGSLVILVVYGRRFLRGPLSWWQEQILLGAVTCSLHAYIASFSLADSRMMLLPAFPFVMAFGFSTLPSGKMPKLLKSSTVVLVFACVGAMASVKMHRPYRWDDWQEGDASEANVALKFPELKGIRVTPQTAAIVERLVDDIQAHSTPSDKIAEFPSMPVLYLLSHRQPSTFAFVHFVDVTSDNIYARDAENLRRDPPVVIVFMSYSEAQLREGEINWRDGRRSGERLLASALEALRSQYEVVDVLEAPYTGRPIEVWARK
jgi:hypothetical protein